MRKLWILAAGALLPLLASLLPRVPASVRVALPRLLVARHAHDQRLLIPGGHVRDRDLDQILASLRPRRGGQEQGREKNQQ